MAYALCCNIEIGSKYRLGFAHQIEIVSTWRECGDFCTVELPARAMLKFGSKNNTVQFEEIITRGMPIVVELGYNGKLIKHFEGYVSELFPNRLFKMKCEDEIFKLRQVDVKNQIYTGQLNAFLAKEFPNAILSDSIPDVLLENVDIKYATQSIVLNKLKETYLLTAYFRDKRLYVGLPYMEKLNKTALKVNLQRDIILGSDNLQYTAAKDIKLEVKAVSILPDNKRIHATVGEKGGNSITLLKRNIRTEDELKRVANEYLKTSKFDSLKGSITMLGNTDAVHGQTVALSDSKYTARNGNFVIDKVTTKWGVNGYRKELELGRRVSS